ncbi:MAG: hemoglobin [Solirubrobacteraceae bacterium]|jgi:hemoglobin|nr:hemoglobin [Solirubrobacteraceae bacterium]
MPDIETRADLERLVRAFYGRALTDEIIGFIFTDVAKLDLEAHVPVITDFWETMLLGGASYRGGVYGKHLRLHEKVTLRPGHFSRWLQVWHETVDELFAGPVADRAKDHAVRVAGGFMRRLAGRPDPVATGGLVVTQHGKR